MGLFLIYMKYISLVSLLLVLCSCTQDLSLLGKWDYRKDFREEWLNDFSEGGWDDIEIPSEFADYEDLAEYKGLITLRKILPKDIGKDLLAINCGNIQNAARIYLNQTLVGHVGDIEPEPVIELGQKVFALPKEAISTENAIFVVAYTYGPEYKAGIRGPDFKLGPAENIYRSFYTGWITSFFITGVYLAIGVVYLIIGMRRRNERHYLFFGLFSLFATSFFLTNTDVMAYLDIKAYMGIFYLFDQGALTLMAPVLVLFISNFYHKKNSRLGIIMMIISILKFIIDALGFYIMEELFTTYSIIISYPSLVICLTYSIVETVREMVEGNREAWILGGGILLLVLGITHDILVYEGVFYNYSISPYLFFGFSASLAVILLIRFLSLQHEVEEMNLYLEEKVSRRSSELLLSSLTSEILSGSNVGPDLSNDITILTRIDNFIQSALIRLIAMSGATGGCICDENGGIKASYGESEGQEYVMQFKDGRQWICTLTEAKKNDKNVEAFLERITGIICTAAGFRGSELTVTSEKKVHRAISYIDKHFMENLNRDQVAELVNLNPDYFGKLFKKSTGRKFNEYINTLKTKMAAELLLESEKNVTEIAFEVGFESLATFSRYFNMEMGMTPSLYRKRFSGV